MSAIAVTVLAGVVVCGPISSPFLAGVVTAMVYGLVDDRGGFKAYDTALVAVGTVDGRALVSRAVDSPACVGLKVLDTVDAKVGFKMTGTTFYSIIVTGFCIVAICTQRCANHGSGQCCKMNTTAVMTCTVCTPGSCAEIRMVVYGSVAY